MSGTLEVELKLRVPPAAVPLLRSHPALAAHRHGPVRRERLAATYFDTPGLGLFAQGIALRVRRERGRWVQTIKTGGTSAGGLARRDEHAWDLGRAARPPAPDLVRLAASPVGPAFARAAGGRPIEPCFVTEFQRTSVPLSFTDGTRALAAIDTGRVYVPGREAEALPLSELELELETGDVARLFELALAIADDIPLAAETRSKAQRGYALHSPEAPQPMRARAVEYPITSSAAEALGAILRNVLDQIGANAAGVLEGDDPEWIHQLRVGMRRLRSALALARPLVPPGTLRPLEDEARWLAAALGPARDLDVLVTATLPALADASGLVATNVAPATGEALATLAAAARQALHEARDEARKAVASPRFQRLLLALGAAAATPLPAGGSDAPAPVSAYARQALRRRHRRLHNVGDHVIGGTAAQRHAARIAAKKLRYAAEFFAPSFAGRRAQAYRDALAALQETLGRLNDAIAAVALASALTSPASGATALVAGWAGARMQAESRALKRAWTAFADAKPFWKDKG